MTKVWFITGAFAFITFMTQISAIMGADLVDNAPPPPEIPDQPTLIDYIYWPFQNLGYFFQLMTISSGYAFLGAIFGVFSLGIIWAVTELIRGD